METETIKIYTECAECIFNIKEEYPDRTDLQIGCYLNRLDKFKDKEFIQEENSSFYRINNRICNTYRTEDWSDRIAKRNCDIDFELDDLKDIVLNEVRFTYDYIININDSTRNLDLVKNCVFSSLKCSIPPASIVIVKTPNSALSALDLFRPFKDVKEEFGVKISVEIVMDDDSSDNKMNKAVERCKAPYFVWQDDLFPLVNSEFVEKIDKYLNIELGRFIILRDEFFNVYYREGFKLVGGNLKSAAIDKLSELAKEQNTDYLIKNYSEIG